MPRPDLMAPDRRGVALWPAAWGRIGRSALLAAGLALAAWAGARAETPQAPTAAAVAAPAPFVVQTALSDFYVEYRLCAYADRSAPRRRAEAINALLGHVQDVFNENGVQIMSPHYRSDPPEPQVVPPGRWQPAGAPLVMPGAAHPAPGQRA